MHQGAVIDRTYAEPISAVTITLTEAGRADPLLADLPESFDAFVGHKEACSVLPPDAVLLASSPTCPVQMFRVRENLYATQFHPELDLPGIITRIGVYRDYGYFQPQEHDDVVAGVRGADVWAPPRILEAFVRRYRPRLTDGVVNGLPEVGRAPVVRCRAVPATRGDPMTGRKPYTARSGRGRRDAAARVVRGPGSSRDAVVDHRVHERRSLRARALAERHGDTDPHGCRAGRARPVPG